MTYDQQGRLTNGIGTAYAYRADWAFGTWQGAAVVNRSGAHGAVTVGGAARYGYDAAGNVTTRTTGGVAQTLTWTRANELASITVTGGKQEYLYDADGLRMRQSMRNSSDAITWTNYELFSHYERRVEGSTTTNTKYYYFGGRRIAQKAGTAALTYLHADHLGSTVKTTGVAGNKKYTPYGATRNRHHSDES